MIAIYPGSFDPATYGHLDIIERASGLADELIVGILDNPSKTSLFTAAERKRHLFDITKDMKNVRVESFNGLLVDFARKCNAQIVIRGLRALTDFEYEFQMALTNRELSSSIETLFIPTSKEYLFLSSSVVKEIARFNGDYSNMVPEIVRLDLKQKFN
ncbi:pantetheine-phosphate adenylyltransferase [Anaeropeptidivorans aminofermentans]|jgi:pantetheine-phosphate adenylyltransferase|uniref:pantetheine-phosphate adenylyltransferase n=1 Tax=Anaeropeptidivorans aminofermentans TaxID=2934315 RepID=UPI0020250764|nr:pantetheine-phosphate adenylyltransferase [Anaeropeptidivorans aminofermentans]MBE6013010.1 pantetheine-phosphate adenylyltransferase [Lachnospiraceae bacterium]